MKDNQFLLRKKPIYRIDEPKFSNVGSANLICPYCQGKLKRFPHRKTNCPFCDEVIYSRSRPLDRRKVLLDENEMLILEKEWESFNKHQQLTRVISAIMPEKSEELINDTYHMLKEKHEKEPGIVEILWEINTSMAQESLKKGLYEKYRYHALFYADILIYASRDREALSYLMQVIFLDLNGVTNTKNFKGRSAYTEKAEKLSVDLIGEARSVKNRLEMNMEELQAEFVKCTMDIIPVIGSSIPPITPQEAWNQIFKIIE